MKKALIITLLTIFITPFIFTVPTFFEEEKYKKLKYISVFFYTRIL